MKVDLHVHVDEGIKIRDLLINCKKIALDGVGCVAHDSLRLPLNYWKTLRKKSDLRIFPGVELRTELGDVLLFGVEEKPKTKSFIEVLDFIKERNATLIAAHPFFPPGIGKKAFQTDIEAVETLNGASRYFFWTNLVASILAKHHGKISVWGSDAHFAGQIGLCWMKIPRIDQDEGLSIKLLKNVSVRGISRAFWYPFDFLQMTRIELGGHKLGERRISH